MICLNVHHVWLLLITSGAGAPVAFHPLPIGSITPKGWLLEQLTLQAEGLSGHLAQFWPDVMDSVWRGGKGDKGLHERTPYWLNGFLPLAYLLRNANITSLPGVQGLYHQRTLCAELPRAAADCKDLPPVKPLEQARAYIAEILKRRGPSGWLGPDDIKDGNMYWAPSVTMLALVQYAELEPTAFAEVSEALLKHLLEMKRRLSTVALSDVAQNRWVDVCYTVTWMLSHPGASAGHEQDLRDLVVMLRKQGIDWDEVFAHPVTKLASSHNVNTAEGLKSAAVEYLASDGSNASGFLQLSRQRLENLDQYYGLPTGAFIGDEYLPPQPLHYPSRGSELCQVVEAMFSYSVMFSAHGDVAFADRVERLAYNALPSTWASPRGGDMWAHQYLQSVNQIKAIKAIPHVWPADGEFAETYGISPNYGCCTANFNQGWPKLANAIIHTVEHPGQEGIAVVIWAPASAKTHYGDVDVETSYPFGDEAVVTVHAERSTRLYLRIPGWATDAEVPALGGRVPNGTLVTVPVPAGNSKFEVFFKPQLRIEAGGGNDLQQISFSVHRGALMYSLPLGLNFTAVGTYIPDEAAWSIPGHTDYRILPTTPWAYALDADPQEPGATLTFESTGYQYPRAPFNHTRWPCVVHAVMRPLTSSAWGEYMNGAAPVPASPACTGARESICGQPEHMLLVPHGATVLRIGAMPLSGKHSDQVTYV